MATDRLFISYRRELSGGHAGRLLDTLVARLGPDRVFMDTAITPGENFIERLRSELATCHAMVVVMPPGWAEAGDEAGQRLAQYDDWVRLEIETALQMGMRIVPALVARAQMPTRNTLPHSLWPLLERQAVELRDSSWDDDVRRLLHALDIKPVNRASRYAAIIGFVALVGIAAVIAELASTPGVEQRESRRLTSYTPTQAQQEALVDRYGASQINVPLIRRLLERARLNNVPAQELDAALETFVMRYHALQGASNYNEWRELDYRSEPKPSCSEIKKLTPGAQFDQAKQQFSDAARQMLAVRPSTNDHRAYAAWCLWLKAQVDMLDLDAAAANASLAEAMKLVSNLSDKVPLRHKILLTAAAFARAQGRVADALKHMADAVPLALPWGKTRQAELMIEIAALHETQGQHAAAVAWREKAQAFYDAEMNPGDKAARDNAAFLAKAYDKAYDKAGRAGEAQAMRDRYGLAK